MIPGAEAGRMDAGRTAWGGSLVCSTDFSIHAEEAADVATWLAQRSTSKILLAHVLEPGAHATASQEREAAARVKLRAEADRIRVSGGVEVEEHLLAGPVVRAVNGFARDVQAGLIVMSSLGSVAPSLLVTASDAEDIAESVPCPTLVVNNETKLKPVLNSERPLNLLCGYDFSKTADSALRWILWIRALTSCKVTLVYATTEAEAGSSQASLTQRAAAILGEAAAECRVVASGTDAGVALADVAAAEKPDILVVGTHQRRGLKRLWLGSVSRRVLRDAATNVAVVPAIED